MAEYEYIDKHEAYKILKDLEAAYMQVAVKEAYGTAALHIDQLRPKDVQPVNSKPVKIVEGDFEVQGYLVKEKYYCCPNCELTLGNLKIDNLLTLAHENKFCKECGQKLDWDSIMPETIKG